MHSLFHTLNTSFNIKSLRSGVLYIAYYLISTAKGRTWHIAKNQYVSDGWLNIMERELCKDGNMSEVFSKWKLSEEIFLSSHCIPSFHPHLFFPHNYKGLVFLPCYITCLCQNDLKVWFGSFALRNVLHYRRKEKDRNLVEIKLANIYNFKIHINQWDLVEK